MQGLEQESLWEVGLDMSAHRPRLCIYYYFYALY